MSFAEPPLHRSYLYAPGSSPRVMRKAYAAGADAVVLDLEDAVAIPAKDAARSSVAAMLDEVVVAREDGEPATPDVHVRINRDGDGYLDADLQAVVRPGLDALRLPKAERPKALAAVASMLDELEPTLRCPRWTDGPNVVDGSHRNRWGAHTDRNTRSLSISDPSEREQRNADLRELASDPSRTRAFLWSASLMDAMPTR